MPVKKLLLEDFLQLAVTMPVLDVRSPGEYQQAHIPGAYNLPLFTDEERAVVGTLYKQQGKQKATKAGLGFFGPKMIAMLEQAAAFQKDFIKTGSSLRPVSTVEGQGALLVHCWRGGMRSAGVAWLLDLYGFEVYTLVGGYKAYRKWVLGQFEKEYDFKILGGYTGSGKTKVLHELKENGQKIVDLEALANHKGSAFGGMGQPPQRRQEMFENLLAQELQKVSDTSFWVEDESQRIGDNVIPHPLWNTMRRQPVFFLDIPFEERLKNISAEYGLHEKEKLINAIIRIQKRLGPLETKTAINQLQENNTEACFSILLKYYDKHYLKSLYNRENAETLINKIACLNVDSISNTEKLLSCNTVNT